MSSLSYMELFSRLTVKILQFHNILDRCRILGVTSFSLLLCKYQLPNMSFFWISVAFRDFFPKNYEIPLLTEMSKNDADIERV